MRGPFSNVITAGQKLFLNLAVCTFNLHILCPLGERRCNEEMSTISSLKLDGAYRCIFLQNTPLTVASFCILGLSHEYPFLRTGLLQFNGSYWSDDRTLYCSGELHIFLSSLFERPMVKTTINLTGLNFERACPTWATY